MNTTYQETSVRKTSETAGRVPRLAENGKKIRLRAILLSRAAVLALVLLIGGGRTNVTGSWKCIGGTGDYGTYGKGDTYTFNEDYTYEQKQSWGYTDHGTYELKDGSLIMTAANGAKHVWDHVERVGNTLREKNDGLAGYRIWEKR